MPKSKNSFKPTKKSKRRQRHASQNPQAGDEVVTKSTGQEYGVITKTLGDCRFIVRTADGIDNRTGSLPGSSRKHTKLIVGDVVLVGLRVGYGNQHQVCDILTKYNPAEVSSLIAQREVSHSFVSAGINNGDDENTKTSIRTNRQSQSQPGQDINIDDLSQVDIVFSDADIIFI